MEIWKDIQNYEGLYQVSNLGRVKSLPKTWVGYKGGLCKHNGFVITPQSNRQGYKATYLSKNGIKQRFSIHRLVAYHFVENLNNYPIVNHLNGIKDDNKAENLQWCTSSQNNKHARNTGLNKTTDLMIRLLIERHNKTVLNVQTGIFYDSAKEAAYTHGINHSTLIGKLSGARRNNTNLIYA